MVFERIWVFQSIFFQLKFNLFNVQTTHTLINYDINILLKFRLVFNAISVTKTVLVLFETF